MVNKLSVITGVTLLCAACAPIPNSSIESCTYQAGQSIIETYPDMLRSSDIPIDHIIALLIFFGVGLLIFIGALFFALFGIVLVAPYFWLVLVIIFVVIGLMSIGSRNKR